MRKDLRIAVATRSLNMHRGRAVGRGNKEGRGETMCVFRPNPQGYCHALSLYMYVVYAVLQCVFEMHTWSQSCAHSSHLLQLPFMCDDFSLECREAQSR